MSLFKVFILGLVQGLTEFLPVSSSGHLVIIQNLFSFSTPPVLLDVLVHLATALAVVVVLWPKLKTISFKYIYLIILASIPAGLLGIFLNQQIEALFSSTALVGLALIVTSLLLFSTKLIKSKKHQPLSTKNSFLIGLSQALAIIPGISRSGSTITVGLHSKLKPEQAFNFSFLLSLPAILGAQLLQLNKLINISITDLQFIVVGFVTAFISGLISLKLLKKFVIKGKLHLFGFYCLTLGALVLFLL
ncbi:undecaprenyl-diphosphate phosphatase [Patescibacteria group bacterium]